MTQVDPLLRALVICPACRGELVDVPRGLLCDACRLVYPVTDGTPWLVAECALRAEPSDRPEPPR